MVVGGSLDDEADTTLRGGLVGISKAFVDRAHALRQDSPGAAPSAADFHGYADVANAASYVAHEMMGEAGVEPMLSTQVADPIVEGGSVAGVFVEDKSGRQAVKAKVVIDATGDAGVAARAGACPTACLVAACDVAKCRLPDCVPHQSRRHEVITHRVPWPLEMAAWSLADGSSAIRKGWTGWTRSDNMRSL